MLATNAEVWSTLTYAELFSACAERNDFNEILKIKLEENPSPDELLEYLANENLPQYLEQLQKITLPRSVKNLWQFEAFQQMTKVSLEFVSLFVCCFFF